jgi:hypothetical protein
MCRPVKFIGQVFKPMFKATNATLDIVQIIGLEFHIHGTGNNRFNNFRPASARFWYNLSRKPTRIPSWHKATRNQAVLKSPAISLLVGGGPPIHGQELAVLVLWGDPDVLSTPASRGRSNNRILENTLFF